eukprot:5476461-Amphidinium_carterae.1
MAANNEVCTSTTLAATLARDRGLKFLNSYLLRSAKLAAEVSVWPWNLYQGPVIGGCNSTF